MGAMENYESPGESDIEYFTADSDVIKDSGNGRSRRNVQKRKRVKYNPENELTIAQKRMIDYEQLNDYHIQRDDWLAARSSTIHSTWRAKKAGHKDGKFPKNYKTTAQ